MNGKFPAKLDSPAKASKNAKNKKGTTSSAASNSDKVDKVALAAQSNVIIAAGQRQKWNFEQETMYVQFCFHFLCFCCNICPRTVFVVKMYHKIVPQTDFSCVCFVFFQLVWRRQWVATARATGKPFCTIPSTQSW